jgi:YegS/Rv2252/BmrU family lipid kinase
MSHVQQGLTEDAPAWLTTFTLSPIHLVILSQTQGGTLPKQIAVIINPAAGTEEPILKPLNTIFRGAGYGWQVSITQETGDGRRLAQEAVAQGADVIAVYGGDGTVAEVASGLVGADVPMAILPGGTANLLALSLGIPLDLQRASQLILNTASHLRPLDIGKIGERYFLLQASIGLIATMIAGADREAKDRMGVLAYMLSGIKALQGPPMAQYVIDLDGRRVEAEGVTCVVANSGFFGLPGLTLSPKIHMDDGLLDVMVMRRTDFSSLVSLASSIVGVGPEATTQAFAQWFNNRGSLTHWQGKRITIHSEPAQPTQADGELLPKTPAEIDVIPAAVQIIVPSGETG